MEETGREAVETRVNGCSSGFGPGEPEFLPRFPAAVCKNMWLLSAFVTHHGRNDHFLSIKGVV